MKNQIKELRVKIDELAQLTKSLKPIKKDTGKTIKDKNIPIWEISNSKEIEKAIDSLLLSKAWLGKILGELGKKSPYPKDGTRKTVNDIEPTADAFIKKLKPHSDWVNKNHIEKVDWLREEIKNLPILLRIKEENREDRALLSIYRYKSNYWNCLDEARFWLGFELQRIKENEKRKSS